MDSTDINKERVEPEVVGGDPNLQP